MNESITRSRLSYVYFKKLAKLFLYTRHKRIPSYHLESIYDANTYDSKIKVINAIFDKYNVEKEDRQ